MAEAEFPQPPENFEFPSTLSIGMTFTSKHQLQVFISKEAETRGISEDLYIWRDASTRLRLTCRVCRVGLNFAKKDDGLAATKLNIKHEHSNIRMCSQLGVLEEKDMVEGYFIFPFVLQNGMKLESVSVLFKTLIEEAKLRGLTVSMYRKRKCRKSKSFSLTCKICGSRITFSDSDSLEVVALNNYHEHTKERIQKCIKKKARSSRAYRSKKKLLQEELKNEQWDDIKEEEESEGQIYIKNPAEEISKIKQDMEEKESSQRTLHQLKDMQSNKVERPGFKELTTFLNQTGAEFLNEQMGDMDFPPVLFITTPQMRTNYSHRDQDSHINYQTFHHLLSEPVGCKVGLYWTLSSRKDPLFVGIAFLLDHSQQHTSKSIEYFFRMYYGDPPFAMIGSGRIKVGQIFTSLLEKYELGLIGLVKEEAKEDFELLRQRTQVAVIKLQELLKCYDLLTYRNAMKELSCKPGLIDTLKEVTELMEEAADDKQKRQYFATKQREQLRVFHKNCTHILSSLRANFDTKVSAFDFMLKFGKVEGQFQQSKGTHKEQDQAVPVQRADNPAGDAEVEELKEVQELKQEASYHDDTLVFREGAVLPISKTSTCLYLI